MSGMGMQLLFACFAGAPTSCEFLAPTVCSFVVPTRVMVPQRREAAISSIILKCNPLACLRYLRSPSVSSSVLSDLTQHVTGLLWGQ